MDARARSLPKRPLPYGTCLIRGIWTSTVNANTSITLGLTPTEKDVIVCMSGVNVAGGFIQPSLTGYGFVSGRRHYDSVGQTGHVISIGKPLRGYAGAFGTVLTQDWSATTNRCYSAALLTPLGDFAGILDQEFTTTTGGNQVSFTVSAASIAPDRPGGICVATAFIDAGNGIPFFDSNEWQPGTLGGGGSAQMAVFVMPLASVRRPPNAIFRTAGNDSWAGAMAWIR
jgi:hypothetical protein